MPTKQHKATTQPHLLETAHDMAKGLHEAKIIDTITLREFEALCLPPVKVFTPREIKQLRLREKISQSILAKLFNISVSTVRHWELGRKHPTGSALKLLSLVDKKGINSLL